MNVAPYVAIITAIVAALIAYQSQLRLKAFELLLKRREQMLERVESYLLRIREARHLPEGTSPEDQAAAANKLLRTLYRDSLVLLHQMKGATLGPLCDLEADNFYYVAKEVLDHDPLTFESFESITRRMENGLAGYYGSAQARMSRELERIATPYYWQLLRYLRLVDQLKIEKHPPA